MSVEVAVAKVTSILKAIDCASAMFEVAAISMAGTFASGIERRGLLEVSVYTYSPQASVVLVAVL